MRIALVYDRLNKYGGAEKVLLALHEIFPQAPLYTSIYSRKLAPWADCFEVRTSFLQNLPLPRNAHEYYPFLMGLAFESFNFDEFDLVISLTHEFAKAIITKPHTKHICYCLTPTSYLWEPGYSQYFYGRNIFKKLSAPLVKYLRWYDKIVSNRPDKYIAISKTVQERIKKIYDLPSDVIYPPVVSQGLSLLRKGRPYEKDDYFLIVSRLVRNKRIDIAVEAFNKLGLPLKIIGIGKEFKNLKSLSKSNIEFLGYLSEEEKNKYYDNCRAAIICGEEDFNIVAVEAQAHGKGVVAFGKGGVTETVIENKTGYFFAKQNSQDLIQSVLRFKELDSQACKTNALKYSNERFKKEFLEYVR